MKQKKNTELRVVAISGGYSVYLCKVDEDGDVVEVLENLFAKEFPSYSALITTVESVGLCVAAKRPVVNINACNRKLHGM